jgi:uncharacterized protein (TIGR02001 family)
MKPIAALAAALAAAVPAAAHAAGVSGLYSALTVTSDYRYQGVSDTDGAAALQANLHYFRPDGWYAGAFASQVDFKDPGHTRYELDLYGGKTLALDGGKSELKLQVMRSVFPDNATPGPTYDFWTFQASARRQVGKLAVGGLAAFVPEGSYRSGKVWRVEGQADYAVAPHLALKALAGEQWGGRGHTRAYWSLGPSLTWRRLTFDLRYVGTDRGRSNCGYLPKICDDTVTASATYALPLVLF